MKNQMEMEMELELELEMEMELFITCHFYHQKRDVLLKSLALSDLELSTILFGHWLVSPTEGASYPTTKSCRQPESFDLI